MNLSEEKKLVLAAQKDTDSFAQLYDLYFTRVFAFVASKVNNRTDAEDLTGDIFMKVVKYLPKFEWQGVPFGAWIFRIARNRLNDYYRDTHKRVHADIEKVPESKMVSEHEKPHKDAEREELAATVDDIIAGLPERKADVIRLKFFADLSNGEIAKTLKLSESNVGVIIYRTLKELKPGLENFKP